MQERGDEGAGGGEGDRQKGEAVKYKAQCSLDGKKWVGIAYPPVDSREKAWNIIAIVKNTEELKGAQFRVKAIRSKKKLTTK